jgi:gamma-glutamyltranspeptidase / glutathione hydrolase
VTKRPGRSRNLPPAHASLPDQHVKTRSARRPAMPSNKAKTFSGCAVATEHPLASLAGFDAIRAGGNAFDAATAASFALGVVLPHMNGLGGDFFALLKQGRKGEVRCINGSGWSPSGLTVERLKVLGERDVPTRGPGSAVVPGMVLGVRELHRRFGRLEWGSLVVRAIELAAGGFPVSQGLARAINDTPEAGGALLHGRRASAGMVLKLPRLAETLRRIADEGPEGFYEGEVAESIRATTARGGIEVSASDLSEMSPEWVEPLESSYRGTRVYEVPPNSMGAETLLILKQLEELEPAKRDSPERIAQVTEATKVAWKAKEEMLGDPRFVSFDLERFLAYRSSPLKGRVAEGDTTYFAVADAEGNLLSCIQSLFHSFGSRAYVEGGGFFLNNRASSFRLRGPNKAEPRKRPAHTLSALLVSGGGPPSMAVGTSAGELRPQLHSLFVTNLVDYSMGLDGAIAFPRFAWDGSATLIERGYTTRGAREGLVERERIGVAQGVELLPGSVRAVCDWRGGGSPAGE